jgi:single-strand DNA-binding protein
MNKVELIGRLTKDPELRYTTDQTAVCNFNVAVDRIPKDKGADFPGIKVFGKQAENCEKYLKKGRLVGIEGRLQTGVYEKDGRKIYTTDVVAERVEFLEFVKEEPVPNFDGDIPF